MKGLPPSRFFPPATRAGPDGLVYFGGRLTPEWLVDAYSQGIFPWPFTENYSLLAWWSPDPRGVIELDALHVPRRLLRTMRSGRFTVTSDRDFPGVIRNCASVGSRPGNTWLGPAMIYAFERMHDLGFAHSVEVWHQGKLVGGTYGLALAGLFAAESMFYAMRDASKVALVSLIWHLRARGYGLMDIQQLTRHTARFGGRLVSRDEYLARLAVALRMPVTFGKKLESA